MSFVLTKENLTKTIELLEQLEQVILAKPYESTATFCSGMLPWIYASKNGLKRIELDSEKWRDDSIECEDMFAGMELVELSKVLVKMLEAITEPIRALETCIEESWKDKGLERRHE